MLVVWEIQEPTLPSTQQQLQEVEEDRQETLMEEMEALVGVREDLPVGLEMLVQEQVVKEMMEEPGALEREAVVVEEKALLVQVLLAMVVLESIGNL
tara:strand:- start:253 stop:543 length:291 start_codon:yes stop_codon:yes gene_type:complete